jgi:murein DD-endopeptidase MepM/ murein hydrolase activator NlpD
VNALRRLRQRLIVAVLSTKALFSAIALRLQNLKHLLHPPGVGLSDAELLARLNQVSGSQSGWRVRLFDLISWRFSRLRLALSAKLLAWPSQAELSERLRQISSPPRASRRPGESVSQRRWISQFFSPVPPSKPHQVLRAGLSFMLLCTLSISLVTRQDATPVAAVLDSDSTPSQIAVLVSPSLPTHAATEDVPILPTPPTPTEVLAQIEVPSTPEAPPALASPAPDPLRFVFPSPGPAPVSAWRPPLYPTPWAPTPYDHFFFSRPIGADEINWPLADYRYGGKFFPGVVYTGIDIPAPLGTPVLAAGPGKVTWAGYGLYALKDEPDDPYGLAIAIKHDFGYQGDTLYTVYGHMDQIFVIKGQRVNGGDLIGLVGETGKVTGPHLHFEVRQSKNNFYGSRNPELWMSPPQGWGVLVGRVMSTGGELLEGHSIEVHSYDTGQKWTVNTYGDGSTNSDLYYRENVVMGDLPAGNYEIWIGYEGAVYDQDLKIRPGMVTYFTFRGTGGFKTDPPAIPGANFVPPDTPTPQSP